MRVLRVQARAFGPFLGETLELAPGMNVVSGPNESGKSSWHAAVYAGLCGMKRGRGRRSKEDAAFAEHHRPWNGCETWAVDVTLKLDDGRRIEIHQNLAGLVDCRATDLETGRDITSELLHDGIPDAAAFLGLTRHTLKFTLSIRQTEVLKVLDNPQELQEQLQRAAATGGADETAQAALERISEFQKKHVGLRRRGSTKPLMLAKQELETAREALTEAENSHNAYLSLVERRDEAQEKASAAESAWKTARLQDQLSRFEEIRSRVEKVQGLSASFPDGQPPDVTATAKLVGQRDLIVGVLAAFDARPSEPEPLTGRSSKELRSDLADLPPAPSGELEPAAEVIKAAHRWASACAALKAHELVRTEGAGLPVTGGFEASELRDHARTLTRPIPSVDTGLERQLAEVSKQVTEGAGGRSILLGAGGVILATAGALLLAFGHPVPGVLCFGLGALLLILVFLAKSRGGGVSAATVTVLESRIAAQQDRVELAQEEKETAEERLKKVGLIADPARLLELARRVEDATAAARVMSRWKIELERLRCDVDEGARVLRGLLEFRLEGDTLDVGADLGAALELYQEECKVRDRQAQAAARRLDLDQTLGNRVEAEQAAERDRERRKAAELGVWQAAAATGIEAKDTESAVTALQARRENLESEIAGEERRQQDWERLQEMLDGRADEQLEVEQQHFEAQFAQEFGGPPEDFLEHQPLKNLESLLELRRRRDRARDNAKELAGQIRDRERLLPDVAAAEENLDKASRRLEGLEQLDAILTRTRELMEAARDQVQSDIAPRLARGIEERLSRITAGRYLQARVDPGSLQVRVRPKNGTFRDAALLSQGTAEQVYLLLRLALAEQLVTTEEAAPLLLDDVFVQSDADRTTAFLDLLHETSRDRQVVLFSQEEEVLRWARERLRGEMDRLVRLERLDAR